MSTEPLDAEGIAIALDNAQPSGNEWKARCPAHDDETPSLSLSDGENGRALLHCFSGCSQAEVMAALVARGLWPNGTRSKRSTTKTPIIPVPADAPPMSFNASGRTMRTGRGDGRDAGTSLRAALAYARLGWRVLPVGGDNGKRPLSEHGVKDATHDPHRIRTNWPKRACNVGIAAGGGSGFWVLDCDGDLGVDSLADFERRYESLPHTIRQLTPSGGEHVLFQYVPGLRNRVRFAPGLDIRTDGGFIVAAPSVAPGKARPWAWSVDHHPTEPRWRGRPVGCSS